MRALALALAVWFCASSAHAQEAPGPEAFILRGQEGVWFPVDEARFALQCLHERQSTERQIRLLEQSLTLATREGGVLRDALARAETASEALRESLEMTRVREAEANAWYRAPELWATVGFVVGAVLTAVIAAAVVEGLP